MGNRALRLVSTSRRGSLITAAVVGLDEGTSVLVVSVDNILLASGYIFVVGKSKKGTCVVRFPLYLHTNGNLALQADI